jgi:hypothetical protein
MYFNIDSKKKKAQWQDVELIKFIFVIHVQNHNILIHSQLVDDHKLFLTINYLFWDYIWKYI